MILFFLILRYGFPLVIVGISIVVSELLYDSTRYGTESFCWLTHRDGFTFAFVGPVVVVLFLNVIFLSIAMYQVGCLHFFDVISYLLPCYLFLEMTSLAYMFNY